MEMELFKRLWPTPLEAMPLLFEAGDLNADGKIDLVVANYETNSVGVLLGNGNGSFQPVVEYASGGEQASSVTLADLNGNGRLDLAVTNYLSGNVSILLGNGNGP